MTNGGRQRPPVRRKPAPRRKSAVLQPATWELRVDIYQLPALARDQQILATPTPIKVLPLPLRRFIGDLSNTDRLLFGLDPREG